MLPGINYRLLYIVVIFFFAYAALIELLKLNFFIEALVKIVLTSNTQVSKFPFGRAGDHKSHTLQLQSSTTSKIVSNCSNLI